MANGVRYVLATTVWTSDLKRAHRVAGLLEAGIVWVNCWLLRDCTPIRWHEGQRRRPGRGMGSDAVFSRRRRMFVLKCRRL